jgi:hypothetical protein
MLRSSGIWDVPDPASAFLPVYNRSAVEREPSVASLVVDPGTRSGAHQEKAP